MAYNPSQPRDEDGKWTAEGGSSTHYRQNMPYEEILKADRENDINNSGAISGAYTSRNDPDNKKREAFAKSYYQEVLHRNRTREISIIAQNTGMSVSDIDKIYAHIFELEHLRKNGKAYKFDPDYDMAQSWMRLREGKNIQEHDIIMLKHELLESNIMASGKNIAYEDAHEQAQKKYNYQLALDKYKSENNLW